MSELSWLRSLVKHNVATKHGSYKQLTSNELWLLELRIESTRILAPIPDALWDMRKSSVVLNNDNHPKPDGTAQLSTKRLGFEVTSNIMLLSNNHAMACTLHPTWNELDSVRDKEVEKGNLPFPSFCCHTWRGVFVPPDLFVSWLSKVSFYMCCLFHVNLYHPQVLSHLACALCAKTIQRPVQ